MKGFFLLINRKQHSQISLETKLEDGLSFLSHRGKEKSYFYFPEKSEISSKIGIGTSFETINPIDTIASYNDVYVVFDGKILNKKHLLQTYPELKDTVSDEYFLAQLYTLIGEKAFTLWEGYGSIVLFDKQKEHVFAVRDSFGTKPLFYYQCNEFVVVSSETRPIYKLFPEAKVINSNAVTEFLLWGDIVKHKQNFFSNINELEPAYYLSYTFDENVFIKKSYYTLAYRSCLGKYDLYKDKSIIETTKALFLKGMESHISESNQLAIGLSGGLDSSAIACSAKLLNKDISISAFTAINELDGGESFWAEKIVNYTNANWIKVPCSAKLLMNELEAVNYAQNIPLFNASSFAQYKMMEAAGQSGFKSIMDGQGSDELFGGYTAYFPIIFNQLFSEWMFKDGLHFSKNLSNANLSSKMIMEYSIKTYIKNKLLSEKQFAFLKRKEIVSCLNNERKHAYFSRNKEKNKRKETLNDYLFESYTVFLPHILRWGEHSAACFGMDCVMPFSDNRALAEFIFDVPSIYKLHDGWGKYLLRFAMKDIIPDDVRLRKQKMGFYTPEERWLQQLNLDMKDGIAALPDLDNSINKNLLLQQWDSLFSSENVHFKSFLFRCMSYLVWRNTLE